MSELSPSMRVKRGFHRIGVALALVLGACTLAIGVIMSVTSADSQQRLFLALRCADQKLAQEDIVAFGKSYYGRIPIGKMGGGSFSTASPQEILASRDNSFSYSTSLVSSLGITVLITGLVGLITYFSVAAFS